MKNQINYFYIAFLLLSANLSVFAVPGDGNDTGDLESIDAPAAPINDYLWVLALVGLIFVFLKYKSYSKRGIVNNWFF